MGMAFRGPGARPDVDWSVGDLAPAPAPSFAPVSLPPMPARKPGFFDQGGTGRTIAGVFGDALLGFGGQAPVYGPMMQMRRQREQQLEDERRRSAMQFDMWKAQRAYDQAHPDDQFSQYMVAGGIDPRSTQGQALYRQRAESMAAPPMMAVDGFDPQGNPTKTFMPRAGIGGIAGQPAPSGPAPGTVKNGYRFNGGNPNDRNSWVPVGGASPAGGATFR